MISVSNKVYTFPLLESQLSEHVSGVKKTQPVYRTIMYQSTHYRINTGPVDEV